MRLADPEMGGQAPWASLLKPLAEERALEPAPPPAEQPPAVGRGQAKPPMRRRHTLGETFNATLSPLLNPLMHYDQVDANAKVVAPQNSSPFRRLSRFSQRRFRRRVVFKGGDCNVTQSNVAKRRRRYLQDIFTTLVDAQWRWTLLVFALNFLLSWLGFAVLWFLVAYSHGDLASSPDNNATCVTNLNTFTAAFLFSVETQHTIGYGSRYISEECWEAMVVMCVQCIAGVMIQAFMVGIVFAKLSRPKKRTQTLLFSRNAVICQRDGQLCLIFRVGDMRRSHIIEAHVRAQLIKQRITSEGECIQFYQHELRVGGEGADDDQIFFIWPTNIVHKIDASSPLYHMSAADMVRERFELVVILEGVVESTGMTTQARSSFLPSEILWGHRFQSMVDFKPERGEYEVDYSKFNNTTEVETPLCSASDLDQLKKCINTNNTIIEKKERDRKVSLPPPPSQPPSPSQHQEEADEALDLPGPESRI
ncbi:G protein-activated inward rectifier potassium channel 3-like [Neocloeon triangulifer]|uniref:G protein-activated inward rectifier potassium channel 3-like n=1 Tax=Neocloeon triangulifer TaxID=2078957 RepID=UPI00286EBCEB|nr:G protein-activated inward rectifier potassium channel 3-like [Neocloeon triangulifer]